MEAMGDITASAEVSRVAVEGEEFESRIQGGVLVSYIPLIIIFSRLIAMCNRAMELVASYQDSSPSRLCPSSPR